jgi:ABC-type uncharacterized transport system auxiliary subunit
MTIFRSIVVGVAVLALGACSTGELLTSKEPQQTIYSLRTAALSGEPQPSSPARIIEISHPSLPPGMDRDRIALYTHNGQKLDYYASVRWSSTLGEVLQNFTRRTAGTVLPYVIAVTPDQNIDANYRLQIKVNEFQPIYGTDLNAAPVLEVSIEFTLIALPTDTVVGNFTLSKRGTASSNRLDTVTAGLEKMLQEIERDAFVKMDVLVR